MKKILAFCFFPAFVPPSNGGESRVFNFYKSLSKFHKITLLTSTHYNVEKEKVYHGSNFVEIRIPKDIHFSTKWEEITPYSSGGDLSAACIAAAGNFPTLMHDIYLEEYAEADIIIHDFPFTINYDLFFCVDNKIRIYNAHNCETLLYKTLHPDSRSQPIWDIVKKAEVKMLNGCDVVLYCNKGDLEEFKKLAPTANYTSIFTPNGMLPRYHTTREPETQKIENVIFIGSGHPPNIEAALEITNRIAPALPEVTFHVIGNCLPNRIYPDNIVRHGFVDEKLKNELILKADLAINPMGNGSGSNVKVFDFFADAIPVLSSEFGVRGIAAINEENCLIAPIAEFPQKIRFWSDNYGELQEIGVRGQEFACKNYSWDVIAENVSQKIAKIRKNKGWSEKFILVLNDYDSFENTGGGGVRTRGIYTAVNKWSPVVFICFSDKSEFTVNTVNDRTVIFKIPKTKQHSNDLKAINSFFHVSADDIIAHKQCQQNKLLISIYSVLKKLCRNIVVEHPYMASIPVLFNDRFVYSSHNCEVQIKNNLLKHHYKFKELIGAVENIERKAVERSSAIIVVSEQDAHSLVRGGRTSAPVIVVPNGADEPVQPNENELATVRKKISKEKAVVFVGSAHMPNIDAVEYIVESLAPYCPLVEFHIVGSVCTAFAENDVSNIHLWGVLNEAMKSAVLQSCSVALNPVISGGGSNIKLADYLANGLFIVTTPFGLRGYIEGVRDHLLVAELTNFKHAINESLQSVKIENPLAKKNRQQFFTENLSMVSMASSVTSLLKNFETPKKKVLFVTYRYTHPTLGGAESMLENLVAAMDSTNDFQIDIIAPEVSRMENSNRFTEHYLFDGNVTVKTGFMNVRFARFPVNKMADVDKKVASAWQAQILFEKELYLYFKKIFRVSGLAWGWGNPESFPNPTRWGFTSCGLHLHKDSDVQIKIYAPEPIAIWVKDQHGCLIKTEQIASTENIEFTAPAGTLEITVSAVSISEDDARPLAFHMFELLLDGEIFDLGKPLLPDTISIPDSERFQILDTVNQTVRVPLEVNLTAMRGPFSFGLESYLEHNVQLYDLVVTHNNIFRPAVVAVEKANKFGVPIISIPHAHLDDDFYHFPDVHQSVINSDLVLAAPRVTCDFYQQKGANVSYLAAGIDSKEVFSNTDIAAFQNVSTVESPFVLVLGRKSSAKCYQKVIDAVEQLSQEIDIHVVMIGPEEDNMPLNSACVSYLGRQPREVVRGALLSCTALVNMSSSESFGIVLLEAWMAGKPVIVNNACAAFHDLAIDNHNALLVNNVSELQKAISNVVNDPSLCERLAVNGAELLPDYDWAKIGSTFVAACNELTENVLSY